jgi:hypothetical protein
VPLQINWSVGFGKSMTKRGKKASKVVEGLWRCEELARQILAEIKSLANLERPLFFIGHQGPLAREANHLTARDANHLG